MVLLGQKLASGVENAIVELGRAAMRGWLRHLWHSEMNPPGKFWSAQRSHAEDQFFEIPRFGQTNGAALKLGARPAKRQQHKQGGLS